MPEFPDVRIGTAEREDAMRRLSDHFAAGRLSVAEFDERSGVVTTAVTRADLAKVFADLPEPVAAAPVAAPPPTQRGGRQDLQGAIMGLMVIAALVLFFTLHGWLWFLLIPATGVVVGALGGRNHPQRELVRARRDRDRVRGERDRIRGERDQVRLERDRIRLERDRIRHERRDRRRR
jgi:hypothetical protein